MSEIIEKMIKKVREKEKQQSIPMWIPEIVGEVIIGRVKDIKVQFDENVGREYYDVLVEDAKILIDTGEDIQQKDVEPLIKVRIIHKNLLSQWQEENPEVGDVIAIKYLGEKSTRDETRRYKVFVLAVEKLPKREEEIEEEEGEEEEGKDEFEGEEEEMEEGNADIDGFLSQIESIMNLMDGQMDVTYAEEIAKQFNVKNWEEILKNNGYVIEGSFIKKG